MNINNQHTTTYELEFLKELQRNNPAAFKNYAMIVLGDRRRYDRSVDIKRIKQRIRFQLRNPTFCKIQAA